ncbi:hybrid sensor histidine kinase/response regulator [Geomonas azotofigens]|uniref:hybrid sensor histidine kinase/response regulator n=1 Tax=Geomonas azotofigens TaxID=2843196 RepID=UPI001C1133C3|nr:ABC transporter substrate binding protein [Geomonas azotofigens]MBU5614194.1 response regulator [Geomonas azotofigens]
MAKRILPYLTLCLCLLSLLFIPVTADATAVQKVLVLHSYDPHFRVTAEETEGMLAVFNAHPGQVQLQFEYLDAKQYSDPVYLTEILDTVFRHKLANKRFDLVLAADNDALNFVERHRRDFFAGLPVVFCGINDFTPDMIAGDADITGVTEHPSFLQTIDIALSLHSGARELIFVGSPQNETGKSVRKELKLLEPGYAKRARFTFWDDVPIEELTARFQKLPADRLVFIYSFVKDKSGFALLPDDSIKRIREATAAPIYSFWSFFIGKGIVGGQLISNKAQGELGAELALRVLKGEAPRSIPVQNHQANKLIFDYQQLERFGISEKKLPPNSTVINLPKKAYSINKRAFWSILGLLLLFATISALLANAIIGRRRAESRQHESETLYKTLVDNVPLGITLIGPDNRIRMINRAQAELLGQPAEWYVGRVCYEEFEHRDTKCPRCPGSISIEEGGVAVAESEGVRGDGSPVTVRIHTVPLRGGGKQSGFIEVVEDITSAKRAEAERQKMEQQLLHAQKLESLGVLAGGIAHDFNNILTTIIGNADLALMRIAPESAVLENLKRIEQAALRAADLARQMLAYSGKGTFVIEPTDLNHLVEEMGHMLEVSISKKASLRYDLRRPLPLVEVDATQIRQIIMNLVINASEAIGDNTGVISVRTGSMDCGTEYLLDAWLTDPVPAGRYVFLEVSDSGCGMDKETLARIFDPFFTTKFTGRGLGMAAVLGIIRGHQGAIKVYSEPGKGSNFKVLLPASARSVGMAADRESCATRDETWRGEGIALLVDDEETVRGIGSDMLRELGFEVVTAADGREAVQLYASRDDIDVVVLDLTMPLMDGEQCFRELRRIDPDARIIMSSGFSEYEVTRKFMGQGVAAFVQKPYKLSALRDVLRTTLAKGGEGGDHVGRGAGMNHPFSAQPR